MSIMGDILDATADCGTEGIIISALTRRANLNHYVALAKCQKLVEAGLVESTVSSGRRAFTVTSKGHEFVQEFRRFQGIAGSLGIRC